MMIMDYNLDTHWTNLPFFGMQVFANIRIVKFGELAKCDELAKIGDRLPPA